jgi:aminomethyltransferase
MTLHVSPLHDEHLEFGARMIESDGWRMPVEFAGVFREYQAHRKNCVVWDASNLGSIRVSGPGAYELIQRTFTNDLRRCGVGRTQYSFLLSEATAGIVDDLMIWWVERELFLLTPSRPDVVLAALHTEPRTSCTIEDVTAGRVLLAIQGAQAKSHLAEVAPTAVSLPAFRVREAEPGLVATTRFGGQAGFELHLTPASGRSVYRQLVAHGVTPAGLGMRETHRMEAGIPRYGFELGPEITPLEAGFARAVGFDTDFVGRSALVRKQESGIEKILRTVVMDGRLPPPAGADVLSDGRRIGRITSSNFSPRLHRGIAFAFVAPDTELGSSVSIPTARGNVAGHVTAVGDPESAATQVRT